MIKFSSFLPYPKIYLFRRFVVLYVCMIPSIRIQHSLKFVQFDFKQFKYQYILWYFFWNWSASTEFTDDYIILVFPYVCFINSYNIRSEHISYIVTSAVQWNTADTYLANLWQMLSDVVNIMFNVPIYIAFMVTINHSCVYIFLFFFFSKLSRAWTNYVPTVLILFPNVVWTFTAYFCSISLMTNIKQQKFNGCTIYKIMGTYAMSFCKIMTFRGRNMDVYFWKSRQVVKFSQFIIIILCMLTFKYDYRLYTVGEEKNMLLILLVYLRSTICFFTSVKSKLWVGGLCLFIPTIIQQKQVVGKRFLHENLGDQSFHNEFLNITNLSILRLCMYSL